MRRKKVEKKTRKKIEQNKKEICKRDKGLYRKWTKERESILRVTYAPKTSRTYLICTLLLAKYLADRNKQECVLCHSSLV